MRKKFVVLLMALVLLVTGFSVLPLESKAASSGGGGAGREWGCAGQDMYFTSAFGSKIIIPGDSNIQPTTYGCAFGYAHIKVRHMEYPRNATKPYNYGSDGEATLFKKLYSEAEMSKIIQEVINNQPTKTPVDQVKFPGRYMKDYISSIDGLPVRVIFHDASLFESGYYKKKGYDWVVLTAYPRYLW